MPVIYRNARRKYWNALRKYRNTHYNIMKWGLYDALYLHCTCVSISNNDRILSDYNRGCFFLHQLFLHFKFYNIPFIGNYISNGLFYPIWAIGPTWLTQLPYHLSSVLLAVSNSAHSSSSPSKDVKLLYIFYVWKF